MTVSGHLGLHMDTIRPDAPIVVSAAPIGLMGGAPGFEPLFRAVDPFVAGWVAADAGSDALMALDVEPKAVIGDLDSLSGAARLRFADRLHQIPEQETTDFDKTLRHINAPLVICAGLTGGRFDHELAVMNTLVRHADRRCIVLGPESLVFHCPPDVRLDLASGGDVGLFPLSPMAIDSDGLEWPTTGLEFAPDARIGTSNRALGGGVRLRPERAGLLVILSADALPQAAAALTAPGLNSWGR